MAADRREISFGLLGVHALSITYRSGSNTRTEPVLPGLGAYLIVQRYTSGRPLGSVSETDGSDEPWQLQPTGRPERSTDRDHLPLRRTVVRRPGQPAPRLVRTLGSAATTPGRAADVRAPPRVHLQIHRHVITSAQISFHAPYPSRTLARATR